MKRQPHKPASTLGVPERCTVSMHDAKMRNGALQYNFSLFAFAIK